MRYTGLIIALLLLTACSTPPEPAPVERNGSQTHIICENGQCVTSDGCPQEYDEYTSEVGPACVRHYGKEEIAQWTTCSRSRNDCACIYVTRDTKGQPIEWETDIERLRCAPDGYRDFMVYEGLHGVDEYGKQYAMIA